MDPQQRMLLECAAEAFEDAGIVVDTLEDRRVAVTPLQMVTTTMKCRQTFWEPPSCILICWIALVGNSWCWGSLPFVCGVVIKQSGLILFTTTSGGQMQSHYFTWWRQPLRHPNPQP